MTCPLCGSTRWLAGRSCDTFAIVSCATCRLARTDPRPPEAEGREHFTDDEGYYERFYAEQREFRYRLADQMLRVVRRHRRSGRVLDVGCGMGFFVDHARRHGYQCSGIERSPAAGRFARDRLGLDVATGEFQETAVGLTAAFDVVTLNHVLEHVLAPVAFLERVRQVLRPRGLVVSASPNFGGVVPRLLGCRWSGLQPSQHVWQFTVQSYRALFARSGFTVRRVGTGSLHYAPRPGWKDVVLFGVAKLSAGLGWGDNVVLIGNAP